MTSGRDNETLRRYREASAELGERPSAAVRAAVLAAAARKVNAQPQAADAPHSVVRRRWPLAAAAAVLLSTLAVMLATRTEQEMPTFTAPADRAAEQLAVAPAQRPQLEAPAADALAKQVPAEPVQSPASPPATRFPESELKKTKKEAAAAVEEKLNTTAKRAADENDVTMKTQPVERVEPQRAANEAAPRAKSDGARETETRADGSQQAFPGRISGDVGGMSNASPSAPASTGVASPAAAPAPAASAPPVGAMRDAPASTDAKPDSSSRERAERRAATEPATSAVVRQQAPEKNFERSSEAWLAHIAQLRRDGRHDEADAELKRFRERYPEVVIPPAALPPFGTR